ncbi:oligosaccharide flippase family protein, partial [Morganella morganii]|uniref:oligosaccharide flippase family protein n=1 Tax=Morganella morganii TaxID=582 RepID=UPI0021D0D988
MKTLIKNSFSLLGMQGINYLIPLLTLPYLTRTLGFYNYGLLNTAISIVLYVILFIDFGFNFSATRDIANNRNNKEKIKKIYNCVIASKIIIFLPCLLTIITAIILSPKSNILFLIILMLPQIIYAVIFPTWLYQGLEKLSFISICTIISKLSLLPLLLLFVKKNDDIYVAGIILSWVYLIPLFFNFLYIKKYVPYITIIKINIRDILITLRDSFTIFLGSISISLYTLSTPIILSMVNNYDQVGYFVATDKLRVAIIGIFLILGQAIYPRANILLQESQDKHNIFLRKLILSQIILGSISAILFFIIMPYIAPKILGSDFTDMPLLLKIMAPMILLIPLSVIISNLFLLPYRMNKVYAIIPAITLILHLIYAIPLSKYYGAVGSSIAILLTEIISLFILIFIYIKIRNSHRV